MRKLLVVTQKVDQDDEVLGFFFGWLTALATQCDELTVICLERGAGTLPANVRVFSLGKEIQPAKWRYILNFYKYIFAQWNHYDTVFVHMNQEYVLLAGWLWRLGGKKVTMWRNHAKGSWLTTLAVFFCQKVFCTSPTSFTARFKKTLLMPVGVDTSIFKPNPAVIPTPHSILFLSRMAPVKRPDLLIDALTELRKEGITFSASFYGDPLPKDQAYYKKLKEMVAERHLTDTVLFYSGVANRYTSAVYHAHEIFVNLTPAGSFDKTIVEALACGVVVLTGNTDLAIELPAECVRRDSSFAGHLKHLLQLSQQERQDLVRHCAGFIQHHSLNALMDRLGNSLAE